MNYKEILCLLLKWSSSLVPVLTTCASALVVSLTQVPNIKTYEDSLIIAYALTHVFVTYLGSLQFKIEAHIYECVWCPGVGVGGSVASASPSACTFWAQRIPVTCATPRSFILPWPTTWTAHTHQHSIGPVVDHPPWFISPADVHEASHHAESSGTGWVWAMCFNVSEHNLNGKSWNSSKCCFKCLGEDWRGGAKKLEA